MSGKQRDSFLRRWFAQLRERKMATKELEAARAEFLAIPMAPGVELVPVPKATLDRLKRALIRYREAYR